MNSLLARPLALIATLLSFSSLATSFAQDVIVVDKAAGPGSDYSELRRAVLEAHDGDLLLIRTGSYGSAGTLDGKGLAFQADAGASVTIENVVVTNLGPTQHTSFNNIDFRDVGIIPITLVNNQGAVWVEDSIIGSVFGISRPGLSVEKCTSVVLSNCQVTSLPFNISQVAATGVNITDSSVAFYGCTIEGIFADLIGGPGLTVTDSTVMLHETTVTGGAGQGFLGNDGLGGPGLLLGGVTGNTRVNGVLGTIEGGEGIKDGNFPGDPTNTTGPKVSKTGAGGNFKAMPGGAHRIATNSPLRSGMPTTIDLTGHFSDRAYVLYSTAPGLQQYFNPGIGALLITPGAGSQTLFLGQIPPSGSRTLTVNLNAPVVPIGALSIYLQGIFINSSTGHISFGEPTQVHVLDPSF